MNLVIASHFLTSAILSLVLPVGVLAAVAVYWWILFRRDHPGSRSGKVR